MAFGDLLGTLSGNGLSVTNPSDATGSVVVSVNDLIVGLMAEQTSLTVSAVTDNLGNTYTAQNAGSLSGTTISGRMFYSIVTAGGTLTAVHFAATASAHNFSVGACAFAGPFLGIDANPANILNDVTTPFTCPATGTLSQATELILAWKTENSGSAILATSPNILRLSVSDSAFLTNLDIGSQVVSSTASVAPEFTPSGGSPTADVLGTASFKAIVAALPKNQSDFPNPRPVAWYIHWSQTPFTIPPNPIPILMAQIWM